MPLLLFAGCSATDEPSPGEAPRLVVLMVADQFRADYLERFSPHLGGGLARLMDEGVRFTHAEHAHAVTSTAPGHATLVTGRTPRHHGIIDNRWYDPGKDSWLHAVGDSGEPSPRRLLASTLGDWLQRRRPTAKVYAAAGKDRAATLMGGHDADGAFWYSSSRGAFKTSDYYYEDDPGWLTEFNRRRLLDDHLARPWRPLPLPAEALEELGIRPFDQGWLVGGFPHPFGAADPAPGRAYFGDLYYSPWLDAHLGRFAEHLVLTHRLGADRRTDLLALGFSAVDLVGHRYGPDSRELLDTVLRLDLTLGRLLEFLDDTVGLERTLVVFTSDHGVAPVPEVRAAQGEPGRRLGLEEIACLQGLNGRLAERFGDERWLLPGPFFNREAMERTGTPRAELEREADRLARHCDGVAEVWTRSEIEALAGSSDRWEQRIFAAYHPERSPDLLIQYEPFSVNTRDVATTHGSIYDYDARVPLIVLGAGLTAATVDTPVRTVDLAPTLAALVGVKSPPELEGEVLEMPAPDVQDAEPQPAASRASSDSSRAASRAAPVR